MFGTDLSAQSVLISKISSSELRRKFVKSALLVGERERSGQTCVEMHSADYAASSDVNCVEEE